jgi:hypothetical protein
MSVASRDRNVVETTISAAGARPVMLVTFDVPVLADAAAIAVDAAIESGQQLLLVNLVELHARTMTASWGWEVVVMEDVDASLRAPAELARSFAVSVERLRVITPRPLRALLELVAERSPGLLVLGADSGRMRGRRYRRVVRRIRERTSCLVWLPAE